MKPHTNLAVAGWVYLACVTPLAAFAGVTTWRAFAGANGGVEDADGHRLAVYLGASTGATVLFTLTLLYVITRGLTRPMRELASRAQVLTPGAQLSAPPGAMAEVEQMVTAINNMSRACAGHIAANQRLGAQLAAMFSQAPAGMIPTDRNGVITDFNPAAEKLFGIQRKDVIGRKNIADLFTDECFDRLRISMQWVGDNFSTLREHAKRTPAGTELHLVRPDGSKGYAIVVLGSLTFDVSPDGCHLAVVTDDTFRRQAEEERVAMQKRALDASRLESLGLLAGGVAHDFNNLLTGIVGYIDLADMEIESGTRTKKYLRSAIAATARARELCKHLLEYAGRSSLEKSVIDLNDLARDCANLVCASSKSVKVEYALQEEPALVYGYGARLHQVVMNLMVNAAEAMHDKRGTITVRTERRTVSDDPVLAPGDYTLLEVADDGCGMSDETLKRVFEPFFTTKPTGTGLGLAAAVGIVRDHGGRIDVASTLGQGTTFSLLFPFHAPAVPTLSLSAPKAQATALVIDDDPGIRDAFGGVLESLGIKVTLASGGYEGLHRWREVWGQIDLVVIDLTMPDMDGEDVLHALRHEGYAGSVFFTSGLDISTVRARLKGLDYVDFIPKPMEVSAITNAVKLALSLKDSSPEP